jgi:hypothetical protein
MGKRTETWGSTDQEASPSDAAARALIAENRRLRNERKQLRVERDQLRAELSRKSQREVRLHSLVSRYERTTWPLLITLKIVSGLAIVALPHGELLWWTSIGTSTVLFSGMAYLSGPYRRHIWHSIVRPTCRRVHDRWHPAGGGRVDFEVPPPA